MTASWTLKAAPDFTEQQFVQWSRLLEERAGICISDQQRIFLQTQVNMRMRELGHDDYSQYYNKVVDGMTGMMEWATLVDRLVVKETSFLRHRPSIDFFRDLLQRKINNKTLNETYDVWSVGCSTGEEPYSLAMVMNDCFDLAQMEPYYGVTATDISRAALSIGREGIYTDRKVAMLEPYMQQMYFDQLDNGRYEVKSLIKKRVCFNHANVLNIGDMPEISFDAIYCQNMLIYFRKWLRHDILDAFASRLKPGGTMIIGLGEVVDWSNEKVERLPTETVQAYKRRLDVQ